MSENQLETFRLIQDVIYTQLHELFHHEWMDDKAKSEVKRIIKDIANLVFLIEKQNAKETKGETCQSELDGLTALLGFLEKSLSIVAQHNWVNEEFRWKTQQFMKDVSFASVQLRKNNEEINSHE